MNYVGKYFTIWGSLPFRVDGFINGRYYITFSDGYQSRRTPYEIEIHAVPSTKEEFMLYALAGEGG